MNSIERFEQTATQPRPAGPLQMIQLRQIQIRQSGFLQVVSPDDGSVATLPVRITRRITLVRISPVDPAALSRLQGVTTGNGMQQAAYAPSMSRNVKQPRFDVTEDRKASDSGALFSLSQIRPQTDGASNATRATLADAGMIARVRLGEDRREWQSAQQTGFHPSKANGSLRHGLNWLGDLTGINR